MSDQVIVLTTLAIYKLALVGIGLWASSRNRTESDFFLGGRGLGPWVAGLSYAASTSSAWVLIGFTGFVYVSGLSALWMVPGIWAGYVAVWLWFGPRLRAEAEAEGHITPTDFMAARSTGASRAAIRGLSALLIFFCFIFYIAAQFGAAGEAFEQQFGLGRVESIGIGAIVILIYALLGGFWAVSVTDTLQGAMMAVIAVALPLAALIAAGGPAQVFATLNATAPPDYMSLTGGIAPHLFLGFLVGVWGVGLGALGQPHLMARLMAVKDEASRKRGFAIAMGWGVIVFIGMSTLALSGRALAGGEVAREQLFYFMAGELFPPLLAGIIIAAVLSAVMSTVDSLLVATSAAVAHDMGVAKALPGREVLISRLVMGALVGAAVLLVAVIPSSVFDRVLFSWAALGAAFGPVIAARVLGWEPRGYAILAAMAIGFAMTVFFYIQGQSGADTLFTQLARIPGDPFERVVPWVPALVLLFLFRRRAG